MKLLVVGLTGGIGAGKSAVARMFGELGAATVDADQLAREVERETLPRIVEQFGARVLDPRGNLDRRALGQIVFAHAEARKLLEAITHPAIVAAAQLRFQELERQGHALVIYEATLLVETGRHREMDRLVVVVTQDGLRIQRMMQRSAMTMEQAAARMAAQLPQQRKAELADYVIDNSGTLEETRLQVSDVWCELQAIATTKDGVQEKR